MTCQCTSCLVILKREPVDFFSRALAEGRVQHIDTTPEGKAIYRQW